MDKIKKTFAMMVLLSLIGNTTAAGVVTQKTVNELGVVTTWVYSLSPTKMEALRFFCDDEGLGLFLEFRTPFDIEWVPTQYRFGSQPVSKTQRWHADQMGTKLFVPAAEYKRFFAQAKSGGQLKLLFHIAPDLDYNMTDTVTFDMTGFKTAAKILEKCIK